MSGQFLSHDPGHDRPCTQLTEDDAEAFIASTCFKPGPPGRVGVELEWIVNDVQSLAIPVDVARVQAATSDLVDFPYGGRLTYEPGGQLEISSAPFGCLGDAITGVAADLPVLREKVAVGRLEMRGDGLDPVREPRRTRDNRRYAAMERYLDRWGPIGRQMMCSTASVQMNLEAGRDHADIRSRWQLLHALAPVLVAMFANSPFASGRPSGWRSTRQSIWRRLDPARTGAPIGDDPLAAYFRYAMDAPVVCLRGPGEWDAPKGLTFRSWLRGAGPRPVTLDDLAYHLTTLFPPVRPRGWYEVRFLDAQPHDDWQVVAAIVTACLDDPLAADVARAATEPLVVRPDICITAARDALTDAGLLAAARACFEAAAGALPRLGVDAACISYVDRWRDRYVSRGRCPADDRLDAWRRDGSTALPMSPEEAVRC